MESIDALIHKKDDRASKEFEKWAILTYSDNRAMISFSHVALARGQALKDLRKGVLTSFPFSA